jgi:hypothetical protein
MALDDFTAGLEQELHLRGPPFTRADVPEQRTSDSGKLPAR